MKTGFMPNCLSDCVNRVKKHFCSDTIIAQVKKRCLVCMAENFLIRSSICSPVHNKNRYFTVTNKIFFVKTKIESGESGLKVIKQ
jgi:hypothetical protein